MSEAFLQDPDNLLDNAELAKDSADFQPKTKSKVKMQILVLFCGLFFSFGSFKAVLCLQSSINIQGSVGAISGTVVYLSGAVIALFFTPTIISRAGAKNGLILSEIGYFVFICGNLYPVLPLMVVASIFGGLAEATIWPSINLLCSHLAAECASITGKSEQKYLAKIFGEFYFLVYGTMIFGNMISFGVLKLTDHDHDIVVDESFTNGTNKTTIFQTDFCGSHDCQDPNVTAENIDHYVPSAKITVYILVSVFGALCSIGIFLHYKFLTLVPTCSNKMIKLSHENTPSKFDSLQRTFKQIINPLQILIFPLTFYTGVKGGFMISEFIRAYGACIIGVENIGLMMAEFGLGGCLSSFLAQKAHTSLTRNLAMLLIFAADLSTYVLCLTVEFDGNNVWICHMLSALQGVSLGLAFPVTSLLVSRYFHKTQHEVGYAVWNLYIVSGLMAEFGVSSQLCMQMKLYIHIGLVTISILLYVIAEIIYEPRQNLFHISNKFRKVSSSATVKSQEI